MAEALYAEGEHVGYGDILSAEYAQSEETHQAVLYFNDQGERIGYYAPDGSSIKKIFLKSPMRFARISSRFQLKRFHPILKVRRPHLGVDYAAPRGTPVRSIGEGVVIFAGRRGGGGKTIKIRHNAIYQTNYLHLNGYARGIRKGKKVKQGQVIGFVGSTGLATGPHLHFEFYKNGRFVDPLRQKFPSAKPIAKKELPAFKLATSKFLNLLPKWRLPNSISSHAEN